MIKITAKVASGQNKGVELVPKLHSDGKYVASTSRFEIDYIRLDTLDELRMLVEAGLSARMYSPDIKNAPSLITSANISIEKDKNAVNLHAHLKHIFSNGNLDTKTVANSRKEQALLRTLLIGNLKESKCVICGNQFPVELLVAAHIKQRAKCESIEKFDFENVVTLMCKLGCDELYERGFISVVDGRVAINPKRETTAPLKTALANLHGNWVDGWGSSKKYYDWHTTYHLGR